MLTGIDGRRHLIPFRAQLLPQIFTDTLVIGSGVAGLRAAIEAATHGDTILIAKEALDLSNTAWARGGVAAAHAPNDDASTHATDTLDAGAGLCDPQAVRVLTEQAAEMIDELMTWGMRFDRDPCGTLHYGREAAHRRSRVLHTDGAATGRELARCLLAKAHATSGLRLFDHCFGLDLLTAGDVDSDHTNPGVSGPVLGAVTHHPKYGLQIIWSSATILATGGAGQVYRETTNPRVATGDGVAMAYRAGVAVSDLEMIQFHPTTLYVAGAGRSLISEAVRGEGAKLLDRDGHRFMLDYHADAELAPRDVVSRAIIDRIARTHADCVYLDARDIGKRLHQRFPDLIADLVHFDLDPGADLIPVHPSAHYTIGGVRTDLDGRTSVPGLFACGEAACNGLHGANRLASNSLSEGLVFGRRAAHAAIAGESNPAPVRIVSEISTAEHAELDLVDVRSSLRSAMWRNVGIERRGNRLEDVADMFRFWARYTMDRIFDEPEGWETQNLLTVGALITRGAVWRCESRGVHRRVDHPNRDDDRFAAHAAWRRGNAEPELVPVSPDSEAVSA